MNDLKPPTLRQPLDHDEQLCIRLTLAFGAVKF
jgi:hypothetical protein